MKTIIILLVIVSCLPAVAQETGGIVSVEKKECIAPVPVNQPQLISIDDRASSCVSVYFGMKMCDPYSCNFTLTPGEMEKIPTYDLRDIVGMLPGVYQARRGDDLRFFGARANGTLYIIDGIRVQRK